MILVYGSYIHAANENWFRVEYHFKKSRLGYPQSLFTRWTIWGVITADSQSALTTALAALEAAYSVDGYNILVYLNDGTTLTQHYLLNSTTINGVQVTDFSYIDRDPRHGQSGCEYVNKRTYRIVLQAESVDDNAYGLLSWEEQVVGIGTGGPIFIQKPALTGPPQRQIIQQQSSFRAIQSGRAVGYLGYPAAIATPIWPGDEHVERRRIAPATPDFGVRINTGYPISWHYEFESSSQLVGNPTTF